MRLTIAKTTVLVAFTIACIAGCGPGPGSGDASDAGGDSNWTCPDGWVRNDPRGCGPAVWLCGQDGGAAAGACNGVAIDRPAPIATDDGGTGASFFVRPDGVIGGAWPTGDDDAGPPAADWTPEAGIEPCAIGAGWIREADATCSTVIRTDCPAGSAPLPGGRCTATADSDCPAGPFADVSGETGTPVYVLAGADPTTADGTMEHPDPTIAAGFARGAFLVIGAGTYTESLVIPRGALIVGLCAARTIVQPPLGAYAFDASGALFGLRGITVRGGAGIIVREGVNGAISNIRIEGTSNRGIVVQGVGATTIGQVALFGVLERSSDQGIGILATNEANVNAQDVGVLDTHGNAFTSEGGSQLTIRDSYVRGDTSSLAAGALRARAHGEVVAERVVMERLSASAVYAFETGAQVTISDAIVRGTHGAGLQAFSGGAIDAIRVLVERTTGVGVQALSLDGQAPSTVSLRSSVVRDTTTDSTGQYGIGVSALNLGIVDGSPVPRVQLDRVIVDGSHSFGIEIQASVGDVTNSIVRRTLRTPARTYGWGIAADYDATLSVSHSRIEGSAQIGVMATAGGGTNVSISDSVVSHAANPSTVSAPGMVTLCHARLDASRVRVVGAVFAGVNASDDCPLIPDADMLTPGRAQLGLHDSVIEGTRTSPTPGVQGNAVLAVGGSGLVMERTLVRDSADIGVLVGEANSTATIRDSAILDTHPSEAGILGNGLIVYQEASAAVERLHVRGAAEFGLLALDRASLDLRDALVESVESTSRGYGTGLFASGGATVTAERVGIRDVAGAGIASVAGAIEFPSAPSNVTVRDALVRHVGASVLVSDVPATSYGVHAAAGSTLTCQRVVVDDSDYGFYVADSNLRLEDAAIVRAHLAFGANSGSTPTLIDVFGTQNATDMIVSNVSLPPAGGLPPPALPPGCTPNGCN